MKHLRSFPDFPGPYGCMNMSMGSWTSAVTSGRGWQRVCHPKNASATPKTNTPEGMHTGPRHERNRTNVSLPLVRLGQTVNERRESPTLKGDCARSRVEPASGLCRSEERLLLPR